MTESMPLMNLRAPRIQQHRNSGVSMKGAVAESLQAFIASEHNSATARSSITGQQSKRSLVFQKPKVQEKPVDQSDISIEHMQLLAAIGCKPLARSSSQNNHAAPKFNIKEGLRNLIKDQSIDTTERQSSKPPRARQQVQNSSLIRHSVISPCQTGRSMVVTSVSPIRNAAKDRTRTLSVRSGQAANKMSVKMALMYKKEVLQVKLQRGEINLDTLERVLTSQAPSQNGGKPVLSSANDVSKDASLEDTDQETPQKVMPMPQKQTQININNAKPSRPKAGSIFRMRSESPANNSGLNKSHSFSPQTTAPMLNRQQSAERQSAERYAGQILKTGNSQRRTTLLEKRQEANLMSPPSFAAKTPSLGPSATSTRRQAISNHIVERVSSNEAMDMPSSKRAVNLTQASRAVVEVESFREPDVTITVWDLIKYNEQQLERQVELHSSSISRSKQLLQSTISAQVESTQQQLEFLTCQRLKVLRRHLKPAMLESFLPLIGEIVQIKDRLRQRKQMCKMAANQPLKCGILTDICARLTQKLVLKSLFLKSNLTKSTASLFNAYYDIVVRKPMLALVLGVMRRNVERRKEKEAYVQFVVGQMNELRIVQVFDCWKRLRSFNKLSVFKQTKSIQVLQRRCLSRLLASWKVMLLNDKCETVGTQIAKRFRLMKARHQLFGRWVFSFQQSHKIKAKAIKLIKKQEEQQLNDDISSDSSDDSNQVLRDAKWLASTHEKSNQLFYADIQDLLLQRDHLCAQASRIVNSVTNLQLDKRIPLSLGDVVDIVAPSQALISNREQIYVTYPDLAGPKALKVKGSRVNNQRKKLSIMAEEEVQDTKPTELALALKPRTQKLIMQAVYPQSSAENEEKVLEAKYSVHAAFAMQQNLIMQMQQDQEVRQRITFAVEDKQPDEPVFESKIVPFRPDYARPAKSDDIAPNELYAMIERQISQEPQKPEGTKIPLKEQLAQHIREMTKIVVELEDQPAAYHRTQALALALGIDASQLHDLTLTSFIQIAVQNNIQLDYLLQAQRKSELLSRWKLALANKYLQSDILMFRSHQTASSSLLALRTFIKRRNDKSVRHWETRQVQNFYRLFKKWQVANHRLIYERTRITRHFRIRFVLSNWRKHAQVWAYKRQYQKMAVQLYCQNLHTKAMVALYRNCLKSRRIRRFRQRQCFLVYFKRRWMPCTRKRQLLRNILTRLEMKEEQNAKTFYQRQYEFLLSVMKTWKKAVAAKQMVVKNMMAQNHYKCQLLFKFFYHLRRAPYKTRACLHLRALFLRRMQHNFVNIARFGIDREVRLNQMRTNHNVYVAQKVIGVWHSVAVKSKIAKMFFKRKYLSALQDYIFEKNYIRPASLREHLLKRKVMAAFASARHKNWRKTRRHLIEKALGQRRRIAVMRKGFNRLIDNILIAKRKRMVLATVLDFRRHNLSEKVMCAWKLFRATQRKKTLMNQVAYEFCHDRISSAITHGKNSMRINSRTGMLTNENQDLQFTVFQAWKDYAHINHRNIVKLGQFLSAKHKLKLLRCFLNWRSVARFDHSDDNITPLQPFKSYAQSYADTTQPTPMSSVTTPRVDLIRNASLQQLMDRFRPPNKQVYAEVVASETDSPAFNKQAMNQYAVSNPMNEYTDQSLLRSDISSIYMKQERAVRKTSKYRDKRTKKADISRNSQQQRSTSRERSQRKQKDVQSRDKLKSKKSSTKQSVNQSVTSSQRASRKQIKEKMLGSQIDRIGKIAHALVTVNPHMITLGQHISMGSSMVSKESLSLNGYQNQYQTQAPAHNTNEMALFDHEQEYYTGHRQSDKHTTSNQTELFQELESIYRQNNEWLKEHADREHLIKQMADEYNDVTSNDSEDDLSFQETSLQDSSSYVPTRLADSSRANPMESTRI